MRALIVGVSGQDGSYLAELLVGKGYEVVGTSRGVPGRLDGLERLGIGGRVALRQLQPTDLEGVVRLLDEVEPDEIYHLSGQSSVGASLERPAETFESIAASTLALLEALRVRKRAPRLFCAGSGECFGDTGGVPASEATPLCPRSPYAAAKAAAHHLVSTYRHCYGLFACTGFLFNHESPLRPERFVTRKISAAAARIAREGGGTLRLGNTAIRRDWGWAPEYVEAAWRMLQRPVAEDLVIATGVTRPLEDFVRASFEAAGLDWTRHVVADAALLRATDVPVLAARPERAERVLGWRATVPLEEIARRMVAAEVGVPR